ncbi:3-alpha,7-alpha,12-alpha-trihydroxy-5-beta-cholest-24-enoyl-CoA hydratase [Roseomonas frigidaquae]|uniref:3-alpha,7-alpha, 12-alpha-trihydroxy-5-beta-cholest-24-enoyl-CoA hydratase n=1 Tax=Falsiroseomonas frigidaquae TaxID=487318 RepID=A0ABX1EWV4_9PROT|nr:MaoC/PaaZ C-terminal domain-containing protein [Falsiroseomonas frigidaquae]NKE44562.1 3-alpha,7-alpha,12-alpha-trihydroxy-5-beta-cholest-24-enoyl-CoA hydratase [Falsiroseomonas frigidaquae]
MPIDYQTLLSFPIPEIRQALRWQDSALYALSLGVGQDPMDSAALRYVTEGADMRALPTMAVVLGYPGFWLADPATGVDAVKLVAGEQAVELFAPLPTSGTIVGRSRVTGLVDRGAGKGALLYTARDILDEATGQKLATVENTTFLRGDGGFGGPDGPVKRLAAEPGSAPEITLDLPTRPEMALIYRLNGDHNPLHSDPALAAKAGFPRPILHGLGTFGVVGRALLASICDHDPNRFGRMECRFSAPVFPGETIRTEIWRTPEGAAFRARVVERDITVISHGAFRTR